MGSPITGVPPTQPPTVFEPPKLGYYSALWPYKVSAWNKARKYNVDELWDSVHTGDADLLEKCLKAGLSVDYCRWCRTQTAARAFGRIVPDGARSLIDLAVYLERPKLVRILINYGADLTGSAAAAFALKAKDVFLVTFKEAEKTKLQNDLWSTPLHLAAQIGAVEMIEILLSEGRADVNIRNPRSRTPLHHAVLGRSIDAATCLLDHNALVDMSEFNGVTPLAACALAGDIKMANLFIAYNASLDLQDTFGETPLYNAAVRGHVDVVRLFIANAANPDIRNVNGMSAFFKASSDFDVAMMDSLVTCGADVDTTDLNGCTALIRAAMAKNHALAKHLLGYGGDVHVTDDDGWSALEASMISGDIDTTMLLLQYGAADVDHHGSTAHALTPLHHAAAYGCTAVARFVLSRAGASVFLDRQSSDGETPLILAAAHGHIGILRHLLRCGASTEHLDVHDNRALEHAAYWGNLACVIELVAAGSSFQRLTLHALVHGRGDYDRVKKQLKGPDRTWEFDAIMKRFVRAGTQLPQYAARASLTNYFARSPDPRPMMVQKQGKPPAESSSGGSSIGAAAAAGAPLSQAPSSSSTMAPTSPPPPPAPTAAKAEEEKSADPFEASIPTTRVEQIINNYVTQQQEQNSIAANLVANGANAALGIVGNILANV